MRERGPTGVQLGEEAARARVLEGAARVFASRGARLSSVEDILDAAGVSRRTFYRFFDGKETVMQALYQVGTERLLSACRAALEDSCDPLESFERCIDAHLHTLRESPRLVFVLGGEAQHHESALHARRMRTHEELVTLLVRKLPKRLRDRELEALVVRGLILALEGLVRLLLEEGEEGRVVHEAGVRRVKAAMMRLCEEALGERNGR